MSREGAPSIQVLLVDDHPIVRTGLRLLIEGESRIVVVGETGNGGDAVRRIAELAPDVVVMDINLPDTTGIQATRRIKEISPEVRVLIVSTHPDEEYVLGALEAGADGYLLKQRAAGELCEGILRVATGERVIDPMVMPAVISRATQRATLPPPDALSPRELDVLNLLAAGATSKEIAIELGLRPKTVENHRARILDKLGTVNSAAAVRAALARGLIATAETVSAR